MDMTPIVVMKDRLGDHVYARLGELIVEGALHPGQRLRDLDLAAELGVSRMPVRETLIRLEREGLVSIAASRTTVVTDVRDADRTAVAGFLRGQLPAVAEAALADHRALGVIEASMGARFDESALDASSAADLAWGLFGVFARASQNPFYESVLGHMDLFVRRLTRTMPPATSADRELLSRIRRAARDLDAELVRGQVALLADAVRATRPGAAERESA
ncbi:GntR family transcriptional regulator [Microbacterium sp. NPDC055683]